MFFANISIDRIQFIVDEKETIIENGELEKSISHFLNSQSEILNSKSNKVFIINGPGSFTNIRIVTLALNMYNFLHNNELDFYSMDKITLYKKLYQKNMVPRVCYMFIGQRKNRRRVDLEDGSHEQVRIEETLTRDGFIDYIVDTTGFPGIVAGAALSEGHFLLENILDDLGVTDSQGGMIKLSWKAEQLEVIYDNKTTYLSLDDLAISPVKSVEANYMMEANVTLLPKK